MTMWVAALDRDLEIKRSFQRAIVLSVFVHLVALIVMAAAGRFHWRPPLEERSIQVSFLPGPGGKPRKGRLVSQNPPSRPSSPAPLKKEGQVQEEKKPEDTAKSEPEKKEISLEKGKTEAVEKKNEPAREKKTENTKTPGPASGNTVAAAGPQVGGTLGMPDGSTAFDAALSGITGDPELLAYYNQVTVDLNRAWRLPPTVPSDPQLYVDVILTVDKRGNILGWVITHYSGNPELDRSVERLFKGLNQMTAPPAAKLNSEQLELPLRFRPVGEE